MCMAVQLFNQTARHTLYALVGYEDGEVAVWDVLQGNLLISKHLHDEPVMAVAVDATGKGVTISRIFVCAAAKTTLMHLRMTMLAWSHTHILREEMLGC